MALSPYSENFSDVNSKYLPRNPFQILFFNKEAKGLENIRVWSFQPHFLKKVTITLYLYKYTLSSPGKW